MEWLIKIVHTNKFVILQLNFDSTLSLDFFLNSKFYFLPPVLVCYMAKM